MLALRRMGVVGLCFTGMISCGSPEGTVTQEVAYGQDDRVQVYEAPEPFQGIARSAIGTVVEADGIDESNPDDVQILSPGPHGAVYRLCRNQRFWNEPGGAGCSGTLIDDRLFVTAGHCVNPPRCRDIRVVFNYYYNSAGSLAVIRQSDVYSCSRIVATQQIQTPGGFRDYAVIELDRAAEGRTPATVRTEGLLFGDPVTLIGFPAGLPIKVAGNGRVTAPGADDMFLATVDAFGGNSGSGVFDEQGRMVGILSGGAEDYVSQGTCNVVNVEAETCRGSSCGEIIGYVGQAVQAVCDTGYQSPRLCGSPAPPDAEVPADATPPTDASATDGAVGDGGTGMRRGGCACRAPAQQTNRSLGEGLLACVFVGMALRRRTKRTRA